MTQSDLNKNTSKQRQSTPKNTKDNLNKYKVKKVKDKSSVSKIGTNYEKRNSKLKPNEQIVQGSGRKIKLILSVFQLGIDMFDIKVEPRLLESKATRMDDVVGSLSSGVSTKDKEETNMLNEEIPIWKKEFLDNGREEEGHSEAITYVTCKCQLTSNQREYYEQICWNTSSSEKSENSEKSPSVTDNFLIALPTQVEVLQKALGPHCEVADSQTSSSKPQLNVKSANENDLISSNHYLTPVVLNEMKEDTKVVSDVKHEWRMKSLETLSKNIPHDNCGISAGNDGTTSFADNLFNEVPLNSELVAEDVIAEPEIKESKPPKPHLRPIKFIKQIIPQRFVEISKIHSLREFSPLLHLDGSHLEHDIEQILRPKIQQIQHDIALLRIAVATSAPSDSSNATPTNDLATEQFSRLARVMSLINRIEHFCCTVFHKWDEYRRERILVDMKSPPEHDNNAVLLKQKWKIDEKMRKFNCLVIAKLMSFYLALEDVMKDLDET